MSKHTIFSDGNYEIAYDDNAQKFYLDDKKHNSGSLIDNWVEIRSPFDLTVAGKEVVIFTEPYTRQQSIGYREKNGDIWDYGMYENGNLQTKRIHELPRDVFSWHDNRIKVLKDEDIRSINNQTLTNNQKNLITTCLIGDPQGTLCDLKKICTSEEEYINCLLYLLDKQEYPQLKLGATKRELKDVKSYFTPQGLHRQALNAPREYQGHMLTLAEAKTYMQEVLLQELKSVRANLDVGPLSPLDQPEWSHLCWPTAEGDTQPIYKQQSPDTLIHVKEIIQAIENVYQFDSQPIALKNQLGLPTLQTAAGYLIELLNADYQSNLANLTRPFLIAIFQQTNFQESAFNRLKNNFLLPLYSAITERIYRENLNANEPNPGQFQKLPVDYWNGVRRFATHQDFLNEQFKNPQAIFVIPDNFDDAKLPLDKRHERQGRGGLAGPMAPIKTGQAPDGSPIYDLCTLGIPTGGTFNGNVDAAKQTVKTHFANLYAQVKQGGTIVVPYVTRGGELVPAFGNGTFVDSPFTTELRPFIKTEFEKLEAFCHGKRRLAELDEEYRRAWESNQMARLSLPTISIPANEDSEEPALLGKDLLNPGVRANFKAWFATKNLGELTEHTDQQTNTRTLTGTLSTGAQITISNSGIVFHQADAMSDEEFKKSVREAIELLIHGYLPGEPPPAKAHGSEKQKAMMYQLLREAHLPIMADTPKTGNTADASDLGQPPTSPPSPQ